jgi:hypothetical protein
MAKICIYEIASSVLGAMNFPFFSGAVAQIVLGRYFHLDVVCAVIALHLSAE